MAASARGERGSKVPLPPRTTAFIVNAYRPHQSPSGVVWQELECPGPPKNSKNPFWNADWVPMKHVLAVS